MLAARCQRCAKRTRDASGRCHLHRASARTASAVMAAQAPPPCVQPGAAAAGLEALLQAGALRHMDRFEPTSPVWSARWRDSRVRVRVGPEQAATSGAPTDVVVARREGESDAVLAARAFFTALPSHGDAQARVDLGDGHEVPDS